MTITPISHFATAVAWVLVLVANQALAADTCEVTVGRLATLEGQVEVQQTGMASWRPGVLNTELCQGDTVRAAERSRATVVLVNQAVLRIDQNTAMRLDNISGVAEERSALSLFKGALQSFSRKPRGFEISTPYLNGSIEGTEFVFRVEDGESTLTVLEGVVALPMTRAAHPCPAASPLPRPPGRRHSHAPWFVPAMPRNGRSTIRPSLPPDVVTIPLSRQC